MKINEESLRELWDVKRTNIHIIGVPEGEEREKETEKIFQEIMPKTSLTGGRNHSFTSRKHNEYYIKYTQGGIHQDTY